MFALPLLFPYRVHGRLTCLLQIKVFGKCVRRTSLFEHVVDSVGRHASQPRLETMRLLLVIYIRTVLHEPGHTLLHDLARIFVAETLQPGVPIDQWVVDIDKVAPALLIVDVNDGLW